MRRTGKEALDGRRILKYTFHKQVGLSRAMAPKGIGMRKVRASQGRITDNVRRRRLPGKCNRDIPPLYGVRVERRGKSSPESAVTRASCKPYPKQHRSGTYGAARPVPMVA